MSMSLLNTKNPEYTSDRTLQILQVLEKSTDVLLNSMLTVNLDPEDIRIEENFTVTMDLHADKGGYNRYYDPGIRLLVYGKYESYSAEQKQPLGAVTTEVVVSGTTWTITIGSAHYTADASGLKHKPRNHWTLSFLKKDDYYTSNPYRAFVMWVNGSDELEFSVAT